MSLSVGELTGYLKLDDSNFNRGLSRAESRSSSMGSRFGKVAKGVGVGLASAGALGVTALAGLGIAGVGMGIKVAAGNEQAKIAFTTMLGSAQKADKMIRDLQKFAANTPFDFPGLQKSASSLISAGINAKDVIPIMTTLGDVTSGMGTGAEGVQRATIALQQMNAAGRITAEDLNQLRDSGIPVYDLLAKATGKTKAEVVKLAQTGKLGKRELDQMMDALKSGKGLEKFNGLMAKQSKSLTGMWSTVQDTIGQGLAKAITPLIPLIKDGLGKATEFLGAVLPKVTTGLTNFITGLATGKGPAGAFKGILTGVGNVVKSVGHFIGSQLLPFIGELAGRFRSAMGGTKGFKDSLHDAEPAVRVLKTALGILWEAIKLGARVLIPYIVLQFKMLMKVLGVVGTVFRFLWNNAMQPVFKMIITNIGNVIKFFGKVVGAIAKIPGPQQKAMKAVAASLKQAGHDVDTFAGKIKKIPAAHKTKINVDSKGAMGALSAVGAGIDNLPKNPTIHVAVKVAVSAAVAAGTGKLPKRAQGGPVGAGRTYLVGERGPELFSSSVSGRITSNRALRGMAKRQDKQPATRVERHTIERQGPLIGTVEQQPGESADTLAERLYFKLHARG